MSVFEPDWISTPGDSIEEMLEFYGISIEKFSIDSGLSVDFIENLIKGEEKITDEIAEKLSILLGYPKHFWVRRESRYREDLARLKNGR